MPGILFLRPTFLLFSFEIAFDSHRAEESQVRANTHRFTPGTAMRKDGEQEEQKVARDLLDDVKAAQIPGHVDP